MRNSRIRFCWIQTKRTGREWEEEVWKIIFCLHDAEIQTLVNTFWLYSNLTVTGLQRWRTQKPVDKPHFHDKSIYIFFFYSRLSNWSVKHVTQRSVRRHLTGALCQQPLRRPPGWQLTTGNLCPNKFYQLGLSAIGCEAYRLDYVSVWERQRRRHCFLNGCYSHIRRWQKHRFSGGFQGFQRFSFSRWWAGGPEPVAQVRVKTD